MRTEVCVVSSIALLGIITNTVFCCKFGDGCDFPCHCADDEPCDPDTGDCANGCDSGKRDVDGKTWKGRWYGLGCQIGNVAYRKPAENRPSSWDDKWTGDKAVDGNYDNELTNHFCAHPNGDKASWHVDLEDDYVIVNVSIVNRNSPDYRDRLQSMQVYVDQDENGSSRQQCFLIPSDAVVFPDYTSKCYSPVKGRYVVVIKAENHTNSVDYFSICEAYIEGYLYKDCPNFFGPGCLKKCNCKSDCDRISGRCDSECESGAVKDDQGMCKDPKFNLLYVVIPIAGVVLCGLILAGLWFLNKRNKKKGGEKRGDAEEPVASTSKGRRSSSRIPERRKSKSGKGKATSKSKK